MVQVFAAVFAFRIRDPVVDGGLETGVLGGSEDLDRDWMRVLGRLVDWLYVVMVILMK